MCLGYGGEQGQVERIDVLKFIDKDVVIAGLTRRFSTGSKVVFEVKPCPVLLVFEREQRGSYQALRRFAPKNHEMLERLWDRKPG